MKTSPEIDAAVRMVDAVLPLTEWRHLDENRLKLATLEEFLRDVKLARDPAKFAKAFIKKHRLGEKA